MMSNTSSPVKYRFEYYEYVVKIIKELPENTRTFLLNRIHRLPAVTDIFINEDMEYFKKLYGHYRVIYKVCKKSSTVCVVDVCDIRNKYNDIEIKVKK